MIGHMNGVPDVPWFYIPAGWTGISEEGWVSTRPTDIMYRFIVVPGSPPLVLDLWLYLVGSGEGRKAQWKAELFYGPASHLTTGYALQPYPQKVVYINGLQWSVPVAPYISTLGPPLEFRPADYDEGGSPYP